MKPRQSDFYIFGVVLNFDPISAIHSFELPADITADVRKSFALQGFVFFGNIEIGVVDAEMFGDPLMKLMVSICSVGDMR